MARKTVPTVRVQVYLNDPRIIGGLNREARTARVPLSQAAGRAIARGLQRSLPADPDDRLLRLERALRDHMRVMSRDMQIIQELQLENARALFLRLPDAIEDENPVLVAAVEHRLERLLDAAAARIVAGGTTPRDRDPDPDRPEERAPEPRSFQASGRR
ncbi:hypothetical protein [Phenylobacterium sp.]|uniref:hypothetical protein n=1 Tax=Phenylobacterium sp. TaxID=1871053 RepID=UPI0025D64F84|nr:hypothetical protein [Phenylobacterium sp.]